ncbi:xanthine dehydrogenase accessory protein XdhC [Aquamicrobium defluvii]|uniref:Molybdenum cofactor sulfurylase n=1 Tax=Aquamicrobium defluvii TaxID=69279 RepID=A0A011TF65_9HYPH|nr:xanthine dehydrogenase accessory protein XdhC [Aquamicrobium defluvii]EXL02532.1 xanthine dehydrogenase [Aquamicrobium defluvii]EZQ13213.1 xanthine dehydrogenase [Halopseudomonas bauzanensis]TDR33317.1 molybdenum cofactor sulfurylase [Aquamicrobium defluvii]
MASTVHSLKSFLAGAGRFALVRVAGTKGSTPRETGAWMLVSTLTTYGTIGGGQLEYMAIDKARQVLGKSGDAPTMLDVPLGPEIGQCCGGRVEVEIRLGDDGLASGLIREAEREEAMLPHFYIFGGGHVGKAIAAAVALLPVHAIVVETRASELEGIVSGVETMLTPMPEEAVRAAPAGSAFAILTHDHALDFLIVAEALKRRDAAYVGMIGSKTKKATFRSWFLKVADGTEEEFSHLVSPIGGEAVRDKRPAVIAALAAAEIMSALTLHEGAAQASCRKAANGLPARHG